jgi:hypothetical protein
VVFDLDLLIVVFLVSPDIPDFAVLVDLVVLDIPVLDILAVLASFRFVLLPVVVPAYFAHAHSAH